MSNIILIGMPTAGKSSAGVIAAKALGKNFLDTDLLIQEKTKKKLNEIISERGIEGFLKIENQVLSEVDVDNTIIATGGSAVYGEDGMKHLSSIGRVIYLKITEQALIERLGDIDERGVVHCEGQSLHDIYVERTALYEKYADKVVSTEDIDFFVDDIVSKIVEVST